MKKTPLRLSLDLLRLLLIAGACVLAGQNHLWVIRQIPNRWLEWWPALFLGEIVADVIRDMVLDLACWNKGANQAPSTKN